MWKCETFHYFSCFPLANKSKQMTLSWVESSPSWWWLFMDTKEKSHEKREKLPKKTRKSKVFGAGTLTKSESSWLYFISLDLSTSSSQRINLDSDDDSLKIYLSKILFFYLFLSLCDGHWTLNGQHDMWKLWKLTSQLSSAVFFRLWKLTRLYFWIYLTM